MRLPASPIGISSLSQCLSMCQLVAAAPKNNIPTKLQAVLAATTRNALQINALAHPLQPPVKTHPLLECVNFNLLDLAILIVSPVLSVHLVNALRVSALVIQLAHPALAPTNVSLSSCMCKLQNITTLVNLNVPFSISAVGII
jgi:hypothetical protein